MKRFLALILAGVLCVSLAGCKAKEDTASKSAVITGGLTAAQSVDIFKEIQAVTAATGDASNLQFDADFEMLMNMKFAGNAMDTTTKGNIKVVYTEGEIKGFLFDGKIDALGQSADMAMFKGSDGNYYQVQNGTKIPVDEAQIAQFVNPTASAGEVSIKDEYVKSGSKYTLGEDTVYEIVLDGKALINEAGSLGSLADLEALGMKPEDINVSDMIYTYTVSKEGQPKAVKVAFAMEMETAGQKVSIETAVTMSFNSFKDVVVDISKYDSL
ncbi:MAG: hypothetical protein LBS74_07390 [Oscillospiraceae bacterium]|nr:hypothetical protein [Oscillospiraceae bacterium]